MVFRLMQSVILALTLAASLAPAARAANVGAVAAKDEVSIAEGEIRKVAKDTGKLTIKHGELKNLGMPAMTMVFRAQDPAMLDKVKVGDKVRFIADEVGGQLVVSKIEVVD